MAKTTTTAKTAARKSAPAKAETKPSNVVPMKPADTKADVLDTASIPAAVLAHRDTFNAKFEEIERNQDEGNTKTMALVAEILATQEAGARAKSNSWQVPAWTEMVNFLGDRKITEAGKTFRKQLQDVAIGARPGTPKTDDQAAAKAADTLLRKWTNRQQLFNTAFKIAVAHGCFGGSSIHWDGSMLRTNIDAFKPVLPSGTPANQQWKEFYDTDGFVPLDQSVYMFRRKAADGQVKMAGGKLSAQNLADTFWRLPEHLRQSVTVTVTDGGKPVDGQGPDQNRTEEYPENVRRGVLAKADLATLLRACKATIVADKKAPIEVEYFDDQPDAFESLRMLSAIYNRVAAAMVARTTAGNKAVPPKSGTVDAKTGTVTAKAS